MTDDATSPTGPAVRSLGVLALLLSLLGGALAAAVPATPAAAAAPTTVAPTTACAHRTAPPGILGVVPDRPASGCTSVLTPHAGAAGSLQPTYQGGQPPLLDTLNGNLVGSATTTGEHTVTPLFWAPPGYAFPPGYEAGVDTYLNDVSTASGSASNVYAVATQYTDGQLAGSPHIAYDVHVGTPVDVTDPFPTGGCTADSGNGESYSACVTDAQMHAEIDSVLTANSLPVGMGDIYLVVFPPDVETCTDTQNGQGGGNCSDTAYPGFCGYHSAFASQSGLALYANIPFPTGFRYTCLGTEAPNGSLALDSALTMISHEHLETITDPLGTAWIDPRNNEIGDECAWDFGTALGGSPGAQWNQVINNHHYELQGEFSNEDYALNPAAGCALTQAVPTASATVTTARPLSQLPVAFDGRGSSVSNVPNGIATWTWDFGDGGTGTGATPAHTYAANGTYTVALTVTDTDGFSASTTATVAVGTGVGPAITSGAPPTTATAGGAYHATFAASGTPAPTFALVGAPGWLSVDATTGAVSGTVPNGTASFSYSIQAANGISPSATAGPFQVTVTPAPAQQTTPDGFWLVGSDGGIFSFGSAGFHGSTGSLRLQRPVVGISPTADRQGYWLVGSDGGVFAFGDAGFHGSLPGLGFSPAGSAGRFALAAPIVAMVPSADDGGYFMVAADGGVFAFGDAQFAGSCPQIGGCSGAAVAVVPDGSGNGYWLVTVTGNVYAFGDAPFLGSPPSRTQPVTSAVRTPDGKGYWILYADGRLSAAGDAGHYGDPMGALGADRATAVFTTSDGAGYWVATAAGNVFAYGDATNLGSLAGLSLNAPIIAASGW